MAKRFCRHYGHLRLDFDPQIQSRRARAFPWLQTASTMDGVHSMTIAAGLQVTSKAPGIGLRVQEGQTRTYEKEIDDVRNAPLSHEHH